MLIRKICPQDLFRPVDRLSLSLLPSRFSAGAFDFGPILRAISPQATSFTLQSGLRKSLLGCKNPIAIMPLELRRVRRKRQQRASWLPSLKLRSGLFLTLFVILGFAFGLFSFTAIYKGWNRWNKTRLLTKATAELDQNHLDQAQDLAHRALVMDPKSLAAARVLAEATEKQNRPETVSWRSLIARLDPVLDNQLNLASASLRFGQLDLARRALDRVKAEERKKASYQVVAGWLARAEGNPIEEERHFAAAVAQDPANDVYRFNLAALQIHSPDPEKNAAARNQLERLSKVSHFRTDALRALLENALHQNQTETANDLAQELQMSPQVTFKDYLLCLDLYRKLDPKKFEALLAKVKPVAARNPHDLAQLINWMNDHQLASDALKWSEKLPAELTSQAPAATAVAASLALTKNWSRLKRWTRSGGWGDDNYLRLAYEAYAAAKTRRGSAETEFNSLWQSARQAASDHPEHLRALARLASQWELTREAESLWQEIANTPIARREALDSLYKIYRKRNDLPNLRTIAQRLHQVSPEEIKLAANAARFDLLVDRNTAEGGELARQTYEKAPDNPEAAVTYAYALYLTGRAAQAIDILQKLSPAQLHDAHLAAYAALIYDDDNQGEIANRYVTIAKADDLFPEERQLLKEIEARRENATPSPNEPKP